MMRLADGNARSVSAEEAAEFFSCFKAHNHILLAVSGGPDSIALMVLAQRWKKASGRAAPKISVATVDHGLRKEARREAEGVARLGRSLRLPHVTLTWSGAKPKSGVQEKARSARYELLVSHAREICADAIAVAHHADDQAETVLLRLAAGSGLSGLAAMKKNTVRDGIAILRPFLTLPSARLRETLVEAHIPFIDDPSNDDSAYARIRMRQARATLEQDGLTRERLVTLSNRMDRADEALRQIATAADRRHRMPSDSGRIYAPPLFAEPFEIIIRVIQDAISSVGRDDEPNLQRLEHHVGTLLSARSEAKPCKLTIGGVILSLSAHGIFKIQAETLRRKV
jgi:tRNA(Ile)-lysidine synthase